MDKRLFSAGHLAIPLLANENHAITTAQPNFLIVERMGGRTKAELPVLGDTICASSSYKIVYREILEASPELQRPEEMREVVWEAASQNVPVTMYASLSDHTLLQADVVNVNFMLSLFQFRGILTGFQLIIDEVALADIIQSISAQNAPAPVPTPTPI